METGTVSAINAEGFGFIAPDRHAGEIWIRPRSIDDRLGIREGKRVEYGLAIGSLGIEAANVRPIES
jgi:cold shock CspA family protein